MRLYPPHYFILALVCMAGLHWLAPGRRLFPSWLEPWGVALVVAGLAMAAIAARGFRRVGTAVVPLQPATVLVRRGFYRFSRNPMYLGLAFALVGVAVVMGTRTPWLVIPGFVALLRWRFILREEAQLLRTFGDDYRAYQAEVRRWL